MTTSYVSDGFFNTPWFYDESVDYDFRQDFNYTKPHKVIERKPEDLATEYVEDYRKYLIRKKQYRIYCLLNKYRTAYDPNMKINFPVTWKPAKPRLPKPQDLKVAVYNFNPYTTFTTSTTNAYHTKSYYGVGRWL